MYEFSFSSYNRIARFYYCDRNDKKAVAQKKGVFFDGKERCYHIGLFEGDILPESKVSFPLPGDYGDNIVRYTIQGNIMTVYFNNVLLPPEGIFPAASSSCKGLTLDGVWPEEYQTLLGGTGWGWIQVDITKSSTNKDKHFIYLYYLGINKSPDGKIERYYPDIRNSEFINLEHDGLMIRISQ